MSRLATSGLPQTRSWNDICPGGFSTSISNTDHYRRLARQCLEMAQRTTDPRSREALLRMAEVWHKLAEADEQTNDSDRSEVDDR
jgi:hypothetical protein